MSALEEKNGSIILFIGSLQRILINLYILYLLYLVWIRYREAFAVAKA